MMYQLRFPQDSGFKYTQFRYPGGEVQVRFTEEQSKGIAAATEVFIHATIKDGEIVALAQLVDALRSITDAEITLLLPYLPYSRADRRFLQGDCFGLYVFSKLLNTQKFKYVVTLDSHSYVPAEYIDNFVNVSPLPLIETAISDIGGNVAVILPDEGAKRYILHNSFQCSKKRDPVNGKLLGFEVPTKEKFENYTSAIIVDDICDGGRTFTGIADKLEGYGLDLYLYVTHGIFSAGFDCLNQCFKHIYTTDSLEPKPTSTLTVIPCSGTMLNTVIDRQELWEAAFKQSA